MITEFILYACPVGVLADQLDAYLAASTARCGPNAAHQYVPHVSLTGFFHDDAGAAAFYAPLAEPAAHEHASVVIEQMMLRGDFHALLVSSPWLERTAAAFADVAGGSPTRIDDIRVKRDLHLSLAYGFPADSHGELADLAVAMVDIAAPVQWQIRLYERDVAARWHLHHCSAAISGSPRIR